MTIGRETRLRKAESDPSRLAVLAISGRSRSARSSGSEPAAAANCAPRAVSAAAISHDTVVAELAAWLERGGEAVLSEREILARERAGGRACPLGALPSGRRPSRRPGSRRSSAASPQEAIEVELSTKGAARLDELLRAWRRAVLEKRV